MKKFSKLIALGIFIFFSATSPGQNNDSISFKNAHWQTEKVARNIKLHRFHFNTGNLFNANENISYVVIKSRGRHRAFDIAADSVQLKPTSEFARANNAIVAINGNFFDVKNGGSHDFVKIDNKVINTTQPGKKGNRLFHQKAAVVIDKGRADIKKWDGTANWEEMLKESDVMLNGPLLIYKNENEGLDTGEFYTARHPRSCVGTTKRGHVVLLVVDGRNSNSAGMDLFELTKIMRWLGCTSAINFDGGGSSTLWVKDKGVINYPSDNKKWDHEGERKVANILYVKKRK